MMMILKVKLLFTKHVDDLMDTVRLLVIRVSALILRYAQILYNDTDCT